MESNDVKTVAAPYAVAVGLVFGLSACTNPYDPVQRTIGGGLIGAGSGAAIGAVAAGGHGAALGAAVGGAVGALGGSLRHYRRHVIANLVPDHDGLLGAASHWQILLIAAPALSATPTQNMKP